MTTNNCCAECGKEEGDGGVSLKACKSCMQVKYCNADCQRNHWPKHKKACKQRATELRDEALFKDPPAKEDCPICCIPMPMQLICCVSLLPATISSVPIYDFAIANQEMATEAMDKYYPCCGKTICRGCWYSFVQTGNDGKCPFCNSEREGKTEEDAVEELMKRVEANDAASMGMLGYHYYHGLRGLQRDDERAMKLFTKSAELGCSKAHSKLADIYRKGGDMKKSKFHLEAAAMAGHDDARCNLGAMEAKSGNMERAIKHWTIAASAGEYTAMDNLRIWFENGNVSRESIDSTLAAYNSSCKEMRSESRDAYIRVTMDTI